MPDPIQVIEGDRMSKEAKELKAAWDKFYNEVMKGLYIPQITKWLDKQLRKVFKSKEII